MKCFKCVSELNYLNSVTLECPYCHALYTVDEKTAEQYKNKKSVPVKNEVMRPNCDVVKNPITEKTEDSVKQEKTVTEDLSIEKEVATEEPNVGKRKSFFVLVTNILMFIPIFLLPFIDIKKTVYEGSLSIIDYSVYLYKKSSIAEEVFADSGYLIITALVVTIITILMLTLGFFIYRFSYENLYYVYGIIALLSLINIICYIVCYFSVPSQIGSPYTVSLVSYIYFCPVLSLINFVILKKSNNKLS